MCFNLSFFNMFNGEPVTYVKGQGYDLGYGKESVPSITVSPGNVCNGEKVGISDNTVVVAKGGTARSRNGIGLTKLGRIIIAQSTTKVTERNFCLEVAEQVSMYYKDRVDLFLMEDGGGSTQSYSNFSRLTVAPEGGRKVPVVTCVELRGPMKLHPMKVGSKGEEVRFLQMILGGLVCDGSYGNLTYKRVKEAQKALKAAGLYTGAIDGSCGPLTIAALGKAVGMNLGY